MPGFLSVNFEVGLPTGLDAIARRKPFGLAMTLDCGCHGSPPSFFIYVVLHFATFSRP